MRRFEATSGERMVIGVSGGLDSTHALIVAAKVCDRLGLPRTTILRLHHARLRAPRDGTKSNAWKLMHALGITAEEIDIRPAARQMLEDIGHPFARRRAGLRHHLRERAGGPAHRLPVPPRQPAATASCIGTGDLSRAGAGLVHLRRRRPDEPLRRQRRRAQDADPVPDPLGHRDRPVRRRRPTRCSRRSSAPRSRPSWCPPTTTARCRAPRTRSGPTSCNDFFLLPHHPLRPAAVQGGVPRLARLARRGRGRLAGGLPGGGQAAPTTCRPSASGWRRSCAASSRSASSSASALPNGPKVSAGGALSPARRLARAVGFGRRGSGSTNCARSVPEA